MGHKYDKETLHPIRNMGVYIAEIEAGSVSPFRTDQLKRRFSKVKKIAFKMYKDSYFLIQKLDGEDMQSPEMLWKRDLENLKLKFSDADYGVYSKQELHPIRHFENYLSDIAMGDISEERRIELKDRLSRVLRLSVRLYFDAERLLLKLD